jgi:hypothetical protein
MPAAQHLARGVCDPRLARAEDLRPRAIRRLPSAPKHKRPDLGPAIASMLEP